MQQPQPLCRQITRGKNHAGDVAARPVEAGDQTVSDRDRYPTPRRPVLSPFPALAASAETVFPTNTATWRRIRSAASAGSRSFRFSEKRNSIETFWPSTNPASAKPRRNAATRCADPVADVLLRKPITGIACCCACAGVHGLATAPPRRVMTSRRFSGRDASYLAPPAQIRTCGFPAYGSHLGYGRQ